MTTLLTNEQVSNVLTALRAGAYDLRPNGPAPLIRDKVRGTIQVRGVEIAYTARTAKQRTWSDPRTHNGVHRYNAPRCSQWHKVELSKEAMA